MKKIIVFALTTLLIISCSILQETPGIALSDVNFSISPYITNRNGKYYLVYKVNTSGSVIQNRLVVGEKITDKKYYFYFIGKTSFGEYDHLVLYPIKENSKIFSLIEEDSMFWLNPDNTEVKLKIIRE